MLLYTYIAVAVITFTLMVRVIKKENKYVTISDLLLSLIWSVIPPVNIIVLGLTISQALEDGDFIKNVDKFLDKKVF